MCFSTHSLLSTSNILNFFVNEADLSCLKIRACILDLTDDSLLNKEINFDLLIDFERFLSYINAYYTSSN